MTSVVDATERTTPPRLGELGTEGATAAPRRGGGPPAAAGVDALLLGAQLAEAEALSRGHRDPQRLSLLVRTIAFRARALGSDAIDEASRHLLDALVARRHLVGLLAELRLAVAGHLLLADLRLAAAFDAGADLVAEALAANGKDVSHQAGRARLETALELAAPVLSPGAAEAVLAARTTFFGGHGDGPVVAVSAERLAIEVSRWHATLIGRVPAAQLGAPAPPVVPTRRRRIRWLPWVTTALGAIAIVFALHSFVLQTFTVPTGSMSPTIKAGDRVAADVLGFARDSITTGDIVVFRRPPGDGATNAAYLVKRVIAVSGEVVSSRGATVLINGRPLREPWLPRLQGACRTTDLDIARQRVATGEYFLLGDCRGDSADSRVFGDVPGADIVGKVDLVYWRDGHPDFVWY